MVPHTPSPPFIPHMQRLRCRAKVKAKALKPHTPGCGACTDIDVMLAVGVFESRVSRLAFAKNKKNRRSSVPPREDIQPQHTRNFCFYILTLWPSFERCSFCAGCGVSLAQSIVRTALSHPHSPGHLAFLFWKRSRLHTSIPGAFFSLFLPPRPPSSPSHPLFPKIASHICNRQRSRRGGRPSFSFPSLSLSMCFCSLYPTVSHPRSSPCNWFYIPDKQSTALKRSCLCARRPAWIVITLCTGWAWGLFGL